MTLPACSTGNRRAGVSYLEQSLELTHCMRLFDRTIYTIRNPEALQEANRGERSLREGRRWVKAKQLLEEARAAGQELPIVFADAATNAPADAELIYWAVLEKVELDESGTSFHFAKLTPLRGHVKKELRSAKTDEPLGDGHIRPYNICHTPAFLQALSSASEGRSEPNAYLLTWNPEKWYWADLDEEVVAVKSGQRVSDWWRCGNSHVRAGDRLFWLRQGTEPRGLFAAGWAVDDWKNGVKYEFETLLHPEHEPIVPRKSLTGGALDLVNWNTQLSGISIHPEAVPLIERIWAEHLGRGLEVHTAELAGSSAIEGAVRYSYVLHRKRERQLRDAKIAAIHRSNEGRIRCEVPGCGFDFGEAYGELGEGYAQVHHLKPLSSRVRPSETRLEELAVVCANCHAMIHLGGQCRSLDELIPMERRFKAR